MLLNISQRSDRTLQEQIIGQIRTRILRGDIEPDEPLISIRELSRQLRVAVNTVQRAYEQLMREGLVYSRQGKGFFVSPLASDDRTAISRRRFTESLENLILETRREGLLGTREMRQIFSRLQQEVDDGDA